MEKRTKSSFRYRTSNTTPFMAFITVLAMMYGLTFSIVGGFTRDDEVLPFCNPPLVLIPLVRRAWSLSNVVINCLIVAVYAAILGFMLLRAKSKAWKENHKVARRLTVAVIVFIFSWFITILGVDLGNAVGFSPESLSIWQSNMVLFALLCYSQAFYVCIWRSSDYRTAFKEQLSIMFCHRKCFQLASQSTQSMVHTSHS
ncbi:unnamed protein product [Nippostrongylus brasiliensis]|uniref:G_PROTEIN_RECEP_F1_2 domain-containing protein n=1 Tax=Nippostrongylus brasiliensis TaxID=27835 RepID=A0A0N4XFI6_NIPBR|nr:unnamed protein product [Nippostrongylus brasiliensis]